MNRHRAAGDAGRCRARLKGEGNIARKLRQPASKREKGSTILRPTVSRPLVNVVAHPFRLRAGTWPSVLKVCSRETWCKTNFKKFVRCSGYRGEKATRPDGEKSHPVIVDCRWYPFFVSLSERNYETSVKNPLISVVMVAFKS